MTEKQKELILFYTNQLQNYENYHNAKEKNVWKGLTIYFTFMIPFLSFIFKHKKDIKDIIANNRFWIGFILIAVFLISTFYTLYQYYLQNKANQYTKSIRRFILTKFHNGFDKNSKVVFSKGCSFPDHIEITNDENNNRIQLVFYIGIPVLYLSIVTAILCILSKIG